MSLYCSRGGVEGDPLPQLRDLFAESLAKVLKKISKRAEARRNAIWHAPRILSGA